MSGELLTGLFAIIGALIGSGGTILTNLLSFRAQSEKDGNDRLAGERVLRRERAAELLANTDAIASLSRQLVDELLRQLGTHERSTELTQEINSQWLNLTKNAATVEVIGPPSLGAAAVLLRDAAGDMVNECDDLYRHRMAQWQQTVSRNAPKFEQADEQMEEARGHFVVAAQDATVL